jgi:hypothetical protein
MLKIPFLKKLNRRKTVSLVRLTGLISSGSRGGISDSALGSTLDKAFKKGNPSAVALIINSPGGSPVQSSLVGDRIKRLSEETKVPVPKSRRATEIFSGLAALERLRGFPGPRVHRWPLQQIQAAS